MRSTSTGSGLSDSRRPNLGRRGIAAMAISAIDSALWDLKAKLFGVALVDLLGSVRDAAPVYGSGGFTSYSIAELQEQLGGWAAGGIPRVKMKVGRDAAADRERVRAAREAIGDDCELFVDANGAYTVKQAIAQAEDFAKSGVAGSRSRCRPTTSPASASSASASDGRRRGGVRLRAAVLRRDDRGRRGRRAAGGRHALLRHHRLPQDVGDLRGALDAALRALRAVAARAPRLRLAAAAAPRYFFDHARIESMLFDGALTPRDGALHPDRSRPGHGVELKESDARRFAL